MIRTVQTCVRCGKERDLTVTGRQLQNPETGGWRVLNAGGRQATHCADCIRLLVAQALEAAANRREVQP